MKSSGLGGNTGFSLIQFNWDVIPKDLRAKHGNGDVEGARNAREMIHSAYGPNGQYGSYYTFLAESNKNVYEEGKDNNDIVGDGGDSKMDAYNISYQNDLEVENRTRTLNFLEDNKNSNARFKIGIVNSQNSLDDIGKQVQHLGTNTPGGDPSKIFLQLASTASYFKGVYDKGREIHIVKQNFPLLKKLESASRRPITFKSERILQNIVKNNNKLIGGLKVTSRRMVGVGVVLGFMDMANNDFSTSSIGWYSADLIMMGVGLTGWGTIPAGIYFGARMVQGFYNLANEE